MQNAITKTLSLSLATILILSSTACGQPSEPIKNESCTVTQVITTQPKTESTSEIAEIVTAEMGNTEKAAEVSTETFANEQTESAKILDLSTTAKILAYYADATSKAVSPKAGFKKIRTGTLDADPEIPDIVKKPFPDAEIRIKKFMSIRNDKEDYGSAFQAVKGKQSQYAFIQKSTLTENDIQSATYTDKGDSVELRLVLKDGRSDKNTDISTLPLEKCGLCTGSVDKNEYDHKNAVILTNTLSFAGVSVSAKESYDNAVVTATVRKTDDTLTALQVKFHSDVKLHFLVDMSASGTICVQYSEFVY